MEIVAVADAQTEIDRQHHVTATREILVQRVCVCVVVRIVPTEKHLSWWTTVNVNDCGLLCRAARSFEQLSVNLNAIGRLVDHFLRDDQL